MYNCFAQPCYSKVFMMAAWHMHTLSGQNKDFTCDCSPQLCYNKVVYWLLDSSTHW
jgi:hypothetical protein